MAPKVLPSLGGLVALGAFDGQQQAGRQVLVQYALCAGTTGGGKVGGRSGAVPFEGGGVPLASCPVCGPDGDQPSDHRHDQQDADTGEQAPKPPVDPPLVDGTGLGRA